jgi:hypothetical protein
MISHIKEKADSILIILSAHGAVNYFLVGTAVPSNFSCILIVLHVSFLVFGSVLQTFLVHVSFLVAGSVLQTFSDFGVSAAVAGTAVKATNVAIIVHAVILDSFILFSFKFLDVGVVLVHQM